MNCPCKCGCVRNTVQELGDHIWRYHRTLSDSIKIAQVLADREEEDE